ncbi:MAG: branched-chain amino acid transaminase [Deltaproteobacteria bacterium]|nr:branched-chain amino acid transaminase [Deltaproteobacteria bacterium]
MIEKKKVPFIFLNGEIIPFEEARIHPLNTAMKYASSIYDAWRGYWNPEHGELYLFRLREHLERLLRSAKIAQIQCPYSVEEMISHHLELIRSNGLREDIHSRIILFVDAVDGGLYSTTPMGVVMAAMPLGRYFKDESRGLHCCVSSWRRISDEDMPPRIKAAANYHNSRLAGLQARHDGYDDAIILGRDGKVTEGPGYTLFIIRDGFPITPPVTSGILEGVTRDTLLILFPEVLSRKVIEREIDRTELYVAEEAFFCGSGAEITPIISVDRRPIGDGNPGPLTLQIRDAYFALVRGNRDFHREWLLPVYETTGR